MPIPLLNQAKFDELQCLDVALSFGNLSLAGLDLASIHLHKASSTISLLAVDRNFHSGFSANDSQLLSDDNSRNILSIHSDGLVEIRASSKSLVFPVSKGVVVRKGVLEGITEHVESRR